MDTVTVDDIQALTEAQKSGFYVRSGKTLSLLNAYTNWCQRTKKPCIVGIRGARDGIIEIDGREAWRGPSEQLDTELTRQADRLMGATLFDSIGGAQ